MEANAQDIILYEPFSKSNSNDIPDGWVLIDNDHDGYNWYLLSDMSSWLAGPDGMPGIITSASSQGKALTPDNWLVTPLVAGATKVAFYASAQDDRFPNEVLAIMASSSGTNVEDFVLVAEETLKGSTTVCREVAPRKARGSWYYYEKDLPEGTRYVAFRHYKSKDLFRLNIDDVKIYGVIPAGIDDILSDENNEAELSDNVIYTINGIRLRDNRLKNLPKGVYIKNGRKVIF
ncbi:MAG: choice-of-anchor J domain-containing protein [Prevotella sp.]|uniref:choice-of-anchor J domain-containing protein n=1 Tax=Prevotella sp. TaxID=59823 RepID=UPI002A2BB23E|nr:choice-of-anchor J domain-containing protein [Prevotella sp.]MDD7318074.1 choice-of-anchor J domain-containing protein [Prevotellaceae bacterium]MDY4021037.1 choice-of-anchor J domain-containing protein [Prevotella sp.]